MEAAPSQVAPGARIAGAILVANGLALAIEAGLRVTASEGTSPGLRPSPVSVLIDLVLGGMLLTGNAKGLVWAKVRTVLGGLVLPAVLMAQHQPLLATLQVAFSGGLLLLLFGRAARIRIAAGLLATSFALGFETLGLLGIVTGTAPLARLQLAAGLEPGPVEVVRGRACSYQLKAAGARWYVRKDEAARKDNPLADRWLVWPGKDAHVLVIAEKLEPGTVVDMDRFAEVVLANARGAAANLQVVERGPLPRGAAMLHTTSTVNGMAVEHYYGLFAQDPWIFQVITFASRDRFPSVKADLVEIVATFETPQP